MTYDAVPTSQLAAHLYDATTDEDLGLATQEQAEASYATREGVIEILAPCARQGHPQPHVPSCSCHQLSRSAYVGVPTIVNMTPHRVTVLLGSDDHQPWEQRDCCIYEPCGTAARAGQHDELVGYLPVEGDHGDHAVEVVETAFSAGVLPEPVVGVYLVVSSVVALAAQAAGRPVHDLLMTSGAVRNNQGQIIGCRRFARLPRLPQ